MDIFGTKRREEERRRILAETKKEIAEEEAKAAQSDARAARSEARLAMFEAKSREKAAREEVAAAKNMAEIAKRQQQQAEEKRTKAEELLNKEYEKKREENQMAESFKWGPKGNRHSTPEEAEKLRNLLLRNEDNHRVLIFGPTSHGKSSFANGCRSAITNAEKPSTYHHVAQSDESVSKGFTIARYGTFKLIDMPGIFESKKIQNQRIEEIARGKVSFLSKITEHLEVKDEKNVDPEKNNVNCVVVVLKYDVEIPPELKRQLDVILELCGKKEISCHLVLTHLDLCDPTFKKTENLDNLYKSPSVQAAVKNMSNETGIPPYSISFVKNYTTELDTDIFMTVQYLKVLATILNSASEQLALKIMEKEQQLEYTSHETDGKAEKSESCDERDIGKWLKNESFTTNDFKFLVVVLIAAVLIYWFC